MHQQAVVVSFRLCPVIAALAAIGVPATPAEAPAEQHERAGFASLTAPTDDGTPRDSIELGPWHTYDATFSSFAMERAPAPGVAEPEPEAVDVPRWGMHEFVLHGKAHVENPFRDAALVGQFTSPSGTEVACEGFFDGGDTWRLRFSPNEEGLWQYRLRGKGVELSQRGQLRCTAPLGHGFIGIHPDNPYAFSQLAFTARSATATFGTSSTCPIVTRLS